MASNQNSVQEEVLLKSCQESQDIMGPRILPRKIQKRLLEDQGPERETKVQEIHAVQIAKRCELPMLGTYFYVIGISFDKTHVICIWVNLSRFKMIITSG